jgi:predicted amidohydrolase YtcJ
MMMKRLIILIVCSAAVLLSSCAPEEGKPADLILVNARVYTMDWDDPAPDGTLSPGAPHDERGWHPDADAIVITGSEITFVGSTADARKHKAESTRLVDLAGATVLPGLVDSHTHVFELGAALERIDLIDIGTEEEAIALVVERAKTVAKGEWIVGRGWDEGA